MLALIYHDVVAPDGPPSGRTGPTASRFRVTPERFRAHLEALVGCDVLLTFDDGGSSAATEIAPRLAEFGRVAHFFPITSLLGTTGYLGADELRTLAAAGHTIGSHSHTHANLRGLDDEQLLEEWTRSKAVLEDALAAPVDAASVPFGLYDVRVARAAEAAGYRTLYTSEPWLEPRRVGSLEVHGRFGVVGRTSARHVAALARGSRAAIARDAARWYALRGAKRALGPAYFVLRRGVFATRARAARGKG